MTKQASTDSPVPAPEATARQPSEPEPNKPKTPAASTDKPKPAKPDKPKADSVVTASSYTVTERHQVVRFRGRAMLLEPYPFAHFTPLSHDRFQAIAYPLLGGVSRSRISDVYAYLANTAVDLSSYDGVIRFGEQSPSMWDMAELKYLTSKDHDPNQTIWRTPYNVIPTIDTATSPHEPIPFVMALAGNDEGLYDDIMQSLAPLVMERKPDGVIWWVGDGANGKSTLMDAIYRLFPGQLSSINVKRLTDGRDLPSLNGTLANVVKESSEGRVEDTEVYKNIGTHENFRVHKFHSQDDVEIRGNMHHIFSANSIPSFNDKGHSAKRRTFIVPFTQRFQSDPEFERNTFDDYLFGRLLGEMCYYAQRLKEQHYRYKFSSVTLSAKEQYDLAANNAEEYARQIVHDGVVAFDSYAPIKQDYENWCADNGYVPLGLNNMRTAVTASGFERRSYQQDSGQIGKRYYLKSVENHNQVTPLGMGRPGLYTLPGFAHTEEAPDPPEFPNEAAEEEEAPPTDRVTSRW